MKCPGCQSENPPKAKFCNGCGARLEAECQSCGQSNPWASRFCNACGQRLEATLSSTTATASPSPESYTPKHLAEQILTSRSALEGERKQVTILFADLKGSMELLADHDPEEARRLLDPVLQHMMAAVHRYEGTVNQVMGDGIMALFGAPLAHEDHAARACCAALGMQQAVKRYAEGVRRTTGIPIQIRVGLNSGEVVVRAISSDLRMDYTAVGQTTHLAARMEQMAVPGSVLLAPNTLALVEGLAQVTPLGPLAVKGLPEPLEVYELTGLNPVRARVHGAVARGLTRFVGRSAEIEQLHQSLALAGQGHGQVVALVGEPGVGKSRLYLEFTHSHRTQGWLVLEGGSASYGRATAYLPLRELLRGYFRIDPSDDPRAIREKIIGKFLALDRNLEPLLPALLSLFELPVEQWQGLDPLQRRQRTMEAIRQVLLRESRIQPLLILLEDLHWIDGETQAVLDSLVDSLPTARFLLLVNYRPEYKHNWSQKSYYQQIRLDPLPAEGAQAMLQALLGDDPGLQRLIPVLIERTGGNPFFLEESVRTLAETKALQGERGRYLMEASPRSLEIPTTVKSMLAARIDRLTSEDKRLLQVSAVIGNRVPLSLLQAVIEEEVAAVQRGLHRLQEAEFLYEIGLYPDFEYMFRHALTQEVAYGSLLKEHRRAVHARVVDALEALPPDRREEHVERLAQHAVRGEVWGKAIGYLRDAGLKALRRSANREASLHFDEALTHLAHLPETPESMGQAVDIRLDLRSALVGLGEFARIGAMLEEARPLAERIGDAPRLSRITANLSHYFWITGHLEKARAYANTALQIAETCTDQSLKVRPTLYLGFSHHTSGDNAQAAACFHDVLRLVGWEMRGQRIGGDTLPVATALAFLTLCLGEQGQFEEGILQGLEAIRISETVEHVFNLVQALWSLGCLYCVRGEFHEAIRSLEQGLDTAQRYNVSFFLPFLDAALGYARVFTGNAEAGLRQLEQGLVATKSLGLYSVRSLLLVQLGEAYVRVNRLDEACALGRQALAMARENGERGHEAYGLHLLGAAHSPEGEEARIYHEQAMSLAERLGMHPLVARCRFALGQTYGRSGLRDKAEACFIDAQDSFKAMGMRYWSDAAEREVRRLSGQSTE